MLLILTIRKRTIGRNDFMFKNGNEQGIEFVTKKR